ncbi:unnamed protein product [Parnassius apollo]|uniref:(apollo) hypothetical protein n=1 Tax=Parnassius apollo TaxID=110799 RepID=A0A8S3WTF1_PARAO|nr:unnamed protein product [Parnassius apollo]
MPRTYVRESNRVQWSESDRLLAINSVMGGRMGYLLASNIYNVPKSSLEDRIKKIKRGKSKEVKPRKENPVLLVLDGHATHTKNLEAIELTCAYGVIMLCLPPHCAHRLQPLDVGFMGPLSTFYSQEIQ